MDGRTETGRQRDRQRAHSKGTHRVPEVACTGQGPSGPPPPGNLTAGWEEGGQEQWPPSLSLPHYLPQPWTPLVDCPCPDSKGTLGRDSSVPPLLTVIGWQGGRVEEEEPAFAPRFQQAHRHTRGGVKRGVRGREGQADVQHTRDRATDRQTGLDWTGLGGRDTQRDVMSFRALSSSSLMALYFIF